MATNLANDESLSTYGYLRDILNEKNNYNDILLIILQYVKQAYAKLFNEETDPDCQQNMNSW